MGIYFSDYANFISIQPVGSVSRVEKSRKEQHEKNKKQKLYKAKQKQVTPATTNPEDYLPIEESLFDKSV
ncbi:MAG: hypothetical protein ACI4F4_08925 [Lachnospiraceae bacterium]